MPLEIEILKSEKLTDGMFECESEIVASGCFRVEERNIETTIFFQVDVLSLVMEDGFQSLSTCSIIITDCLKP